MGQPPPRKGAYNKFVMNLHKDQFNKLQAKNQQELDLLDDIRLFRDHVNGKKVISCNMFFFF